jgi:histidinol-phosphate/aromatic aminotransferase/cobyric acid decarboxylase-like protein
MHLGHLGLARTTAELAGPGGKVLLFDASLSRTSMAEDFRTALRRSSGPALEVVDADSGVDVRQVQQQALSALRLEKLRRLYGWDDKTPASSLTDLGAMLSFFLYSPGDDGPGFALVDALQAPHSVVLPTAARAVGVEAPTLLYRRLFPSLRRYGARGSARDPASTLFMDDSEEAVHRKFLRAITGGRATADQQRELGGDPTRCAAFSVIELLCPPQTAENALARCQSGQTLCAQCKSKHADVVASGLREAMTPPARPGAPTAIRDSVVHAATALHRLPPQEQSSLEEKIAARTGVLPGQVVVGRGSTEVMDWAFRLQSTPGATVVATEPTFGLYRDLADRHGFEYAGVPWDAQALAHDASGLLRAVDDKTALCVLDIPHTVSGVGPAAHLIKDMSRALPPSTLLLLDMVAADFMRSGRPGPPADLLQRYPNIVIYGSLSKSHSLLGIRVGYALAAGPVARRLRAQRLPYAMDTLSLAAAERALRDDAAVRNTVQASLQARARLTRFLDRRGIRYAPTESNALLMDLGPWFEPVSRRLAAAGVKFRDGRRWGLAGWAQVHLIDVPGAELVIDALRDVSKDSGPP